MPDGTRVQQLSASDILMLMESLPCYSTYLSAGNESCIKARTAGNVTPNNVGKGLDTIPNSNQRFATVCEICPVLLIAYSRMFAS